MSAFTREQLESPYVWLWESDIKEQQMVTINLAAFAIALLDRAETAEKRMKAWGCPDFDFICLNCGRETPCITEADLRPGDPGVPCTFDLTYPQMIERLRHYEDRQRKAEAERDEARAMKVPATTEAVTLAEMGEKVARTEAWAAKEELRAAEAERDRLEDLLRRIDRLDEKADAASWQQQAEDRGDLALQIAAERDRLQRALDLSEQAHHEIREVCERHGVANVLALSVRLESVCDERDRLRDDLSKCGEEKSIQESIHDLLTERDRLRAQLDSILANSDSLESGKLADAHAEIKRLREELREVSGAIIWLAAVKMFNAVPPDQVLAAITRARERAGRG